MDKHTPSSHVISSTTDPQVIDIVGFTIVEIIISVVVVILFIDIVVGLSGLGPEVRPFNRLLLSEENVV